MAMSRCAGGTSLTTRSPMRITPLVGYSRPASMRSVVVLPQPEGPSRLTNSPSAIVRSSPLTATAEPKALRTFSKLTPAILPPQPFTPPAPKPLVR